MGKYNFKHYQHTQEYVYELNKPTNKPNQPFRVMDEVLVVGKHRGKKLNEVPQHYLNWLLLNFKGLNDTSIRIIKKYL